MTRENPTPDPTGITSAESLPGPKAPPAPDLELEGSFTTRLAATSPDRIAISIPAPFLDAGTPGTLLRMVPVEHLRGDPIELYLKVGPHFTLGRSPGADWVTCFFPRNEKNDERSKRMSKIHARLGLWEDRLRIQRASNSALHIGEHEVSSEPGGTGVRERDRITFAEDYCLEVLYDISLQGTVRFTNGEAWRKGKIDFRPGLLGAIRFEPVNSAIGFRNSCWLFVDVAFGSARGGILTAGAGLAPQQGVFFFIGGCFWILNLINNGKMTINDYRLADREITPLTEGDTIWMGEIRYRVEIR